MIEAIEATFGYTLARSHFCLKDRTTFRSKRKWTQDEAEQLITAMMASACCDVEFSQKTYSLIWPARTTEECRAEPFSERLEGFSDG